MLCMTHEWAAETFFPSLRSRLSAPFTYERHKSEPLSVQPSVDGGEAKVDDENGLLGNSENRKEKLCLLRFLSNLFLRYQHFLHIDDFSLLVPAGWAWSEFV